MDLLAAYGAGLATLTAAWSFSREIRSRRRAAQVSGVASIWVSDGTSLPSLRAAMTGHSPIQLPWRVEISVANTGMADLEVSRVYVRQESDTGARAWHAASRELPKTLKNDQGATFVLEIQSEPLDFRSPLVAVVETATGRRFESSSFGTRSDTLIAVRRDAFEAHLGLKMEDLPNAFLYEVTIDGDSGPARQDPNHG